MRGQCEEEGGGRMSQQVRESVDISFMLRLVWRLAAYTSGPVSNLLKVRDP